jgi:hypothetical protein
LFSPPPAVPASRRPRLALRSASQCSFPQDLA